MTSQDEETLSRALKLVGWCKVVVGIDDDGSVPFSAGARDLSLTKSPLCMG